MNQTISGLFLSNVIQSSHLISFSYSFSSVIVGKSSFHRHFASILYSRSNQLLLHVSESNFNKIMSSSICVENQKYENGQYSTSMRVRESEVELVKCQFSYCYEKGSGACVCISDSSASFKCVLTIFFSGFADDNGGALFLGTQSSLILRSCLYNCSAKNMGQGCYSIGADKSNQQMNDTTVCLCSTEPMKWNGYGLYLQRGAYSFMYDNFSLCFSSRGGSAFSTHLSTIQNVTYCHIKDCSSASIIEFLFSKTELWIYRSNLINNTANGRTPAICYSSDTYAVECYFIGNPRPLTMQSAGRPSIITFINCLYDAFGFVSLNGIVTTGCRNIGVNDAPNAFTPRKSGGCHVIDGKRPTNYVRLSAIIGVFIVVVAFLIFALSNNSNLFRASEAQKRRLRSRPLSRLEANI